MSQQSDTQESQEQICQLEVTSHRGGGGTLGETKNVMLSFGQRKKIQILLLHSNSIMVVAWKKSIAGCWLPKTITTLEQVNSFPGYIHHNHHDFNYTQHL